mmetsp:Transcript_37446/g.67698  ORF Transcript_37446/g.67698 Transcript_37446/m.67698 type:complete len:382 (+) Transcript_37446:66-1211(+)|eukprot:CAMPEP_0197664130 /NCGR_PEP_ID=MMETSP1338-20131121/58449_1 /TAXON_ID=43686 ORGANISM="Pelagodinium beii, Strain RCC1491" /NCGR_SAMPLE_ID=MMETSP1338 /ASSEMBLY_ACC=CAM_ASM_000754 /LENGTH=381 /DNA_ID=CAMNT_0043242707 /DNA_START=30 /DNA_END=1175 /DNA_ORIENTATION=-
MGAKCCGGDGGRGKDVDKMSQAPGEAGPGEESGGFRVSDLPDCLKAVYLEGFPGKPSFTVERGKECYHEDYVSHANIIEPGKPGPGPEDISNLVIGFNKPVPDFKWDVKMVFRVGMPKGDKYVLCSTCSGTPEEEFLGTKPTGKGFNFMAIDIHWVLDDKIKESWHIEELATAIEQMTNKDSPAKVPPLHKGQEPHFDKAVQSSSALGKQIKESDMPDCLKTFYQKMLVDKSTTAETVAAALHENWISHPNGDESGTEGPGAKGQFEILQNAWKTFPDWKWKTEAVLQVPLMENPAGPSQEMLIHLATVEGSSDGKFLGLDLKSPKKFHIMAIDMHIVEEGKIAESWHIEDWGSCHEQLKAEGDAKLHNGQLPLNAEVGMA